MDGYAKVALLMSRHNEYGIVRRFGELNFKNLLYLQAELVELEAQLLALAEADKRSQNDERLYYEKHWGLLSDSRNDGHDEQWKKMLEIREKLKEYNECLAHQTMLSRMSKPNKYNLGFFQDWLCRPEMGNFPIISSDREAWSKETEPDLIVVDDHIRKDIFSAWTTEKLLPAFHSTIGKRFKGAISWDPSSGMSSYSDSRIQGVIDVFGTVVASLFPIASIVALCFVSRTTVRLGIIAAFTALFSLSLSLLTQARRVEIFAATTAYAAVQVVFISANGSSSAG